MSFWKTACLATQGSLHMKNEIECQDVVASFNKNGMSVIALADGAGSCMHSLEGATIAANAVCKYMANNFVKIFKDEEVLEIKQELLEDILHRLNKRAKRLKCDVKELSSTLMFVVIKDDTQCIVGHIGDGCVVSKDKEGWRIVSSETKVDLVNETLFTTSPNVVSLMKMYKGELRPGSTCFAIMSDGTECSLIDKQDPSDIKVAKAVAVMSNWMKSNSTQDVNNAFKNTLENKISKMTQDDCSIAFLTKVKLETTYDELDYDAKQEVFEKHYTHLYNVEAAIEDANFILKVLKVTDATSLYISKRTKLKQATCSKILDILHKSGYLALDNDIYSLISRQDMISE